MIRNRNKITIYPIKKKLKRIILTGKEDLKRIRGKKKAPDPAAKIHLLNE
jgi:hypothetical protein